MGQSVATLGFTLEQRGDMWVIAWEDGGCRPATSAEIVMWLRLREV